MPTSRKQYSVADDDDDGGDDDAQKAEATREQTMFYTLTYLLHTYLQLTICLHVKTGE